MPAVIPPFWALPGLQEVEFGLLSVLLQPVSHLEDKLYNTLALLTVSGYLLLPILFQQIERSLNWPAIKELEGGESCGGLRHLPVCQEKKWKPLIPILPVSDTNFLSILLRV